MSLVLINTVPEGTEVRTRGYFPNLVSFNEYWIDLGDFMDVLLRTLRGRVGICWIRRYDLNERLMHSIKVLAYEDGLIIGPCRVPWSDLAGMVEYVMTNTDLLRYKDPRSQFVRVVRRFRAPKRQIAGAGLQTYQRDLLKFLLDLKRVTGYGENRKRFE